MEQWRLLGGGRTFLHSEFHKNKNSETFLDKTILNVFKSPNN
jgi:hypothetical protein